MKNIHLIAILDDDIFCIKIVLFVFILFVFIYLHVNVFSHLLSAAYKMTSGPLHASLGILVRLHAKHNKPMIHSSSLASKIRGMQRGMRTSSAAS